MDLPQKLAFVVQPNRLQGLIWQALLRSQRISVILESANEELADCISQISAAGLALPDMIILDAETPGINPYEFCRWCREHFPSIKVFLTRIHAQPLSETERRWAQKQGALSFLNGFNRDNLMRTAVTNIKEILAIVDAPFLDERALLPVLLNVRRHIGTTATPVSESTAKAPVVSPLAGPTPVDASSRQPKPQLDALPDLDWVASGLRALNQTKVKAEIQTAGSFAPVPLGLTGGVAREKAPVSAPPGAAPSRRYRGVAY